MRRLIYIIVGVTAFLSRANAMQGVTYNRQDSVEIVTLLKEATIHSQANWVMFFAKKLIGRPYVGGTLDRARTEKLVVNLQELDCTTFVEQVLAMAICARQGKTTFDAFLEHLRHIRYIGGEVAYTKRQHYFTTWINDNQQEGIITDIQSPNPPFTAVQTIQVDYMTTHVNAYRMLSAHPEWLKGIREMEQAINGKRYRYIPKAAIRNNQLFRQTIKDGDVLVMITNKKGLDTTHIGFAHWKSDGLHLLNASSIHRQVVDEPMTLYQYMRKHPSQIGIRACRLKGSLSYLKQ